eukprot:gb/GECG01003715.1/.p1 GENE.gb/GECG01003715.1/~~gb/GECG01003715.1/.p1  ORF type:complete len:459 (+),score=71.34 gb/GECG01003715.1/:1-1377(+)
MEQATQKSNVNSREDEESSTGTSMAQASTQPAVAGTNAEEDDEDVLSDVDQPIPQGQESEDETEECSTSLEKSTQENLAAILSRRKKRQGNDNLQENKGDLDQQRSDQSNTDISMAGNPVTSIGTSQQVSGDPQSKELNEESTTAGRASGVGSNADRSGEVVPSQAPAVDTHTVRDVPDPNAYPKSPDALSDIKGASPVSVTPLTHEAGRSPQSVSSSEMARRAKVSQGMVFSRESLQQYTEQRLRESKQRSPTKTLSADVAFLSDIHSPGYRNDKKPLSIRNRASLPAPMSASGDAKETNEVNAVLQPVISQYQSIAAKALIGATLRLENPWKNDGSSFPVYVRSTEDYHRLLWSSEDNDGHSRIIFGEIFVETISKIVCGRGDLSIEVHLKEPPGVAKQEGGAGSEKQTLEWPAVPRKRTVRPWKIFPADSLQRRDWILIISMTHGIWTIQGEACS